MCPKMSKPEGKSEKFLFGGSENKIIKKKKKCFDPPQFLKNFQAFGA